MKSHFLSRSGTSRWQTRRALSGAEELVNGCGSFSYRLCPFCFVIFVDATEFMSHIDSFHIAGCKKELRSSMPERVTGCEMELLKSWRWEPMPSDGDDLAERALILSKLKSIVSWLIDKDAVSLSLLYIMYKFIMSRVRPVKPSVISMCGSCGIGQLSSAHLKELLDLLKWLPHTHTDYKQENQKDSLGLATWMEESGTLFFDYRKNASRKTDDSSQPDEFFDWLFCESLLEDRCESWLGMREKCVNLGPAIFKKITEELDKLKLKCSSCEELKQKGGVYFLPKAILESDIDIEPYFYDGIGSVQTEMLLIDAEVDYQKKRLLEACKVDYLAAILPIAKSYLWAKLNNNPPEKVLPLPPPNGLQLQAPLNVILRSLWHIRRFHDTLQKIPRECRDVTVGDFQIEKELLEIFDSWDLVKDGKPCEPSGSTRFADFTSSLIKKFKSFSELLVARESRNGSVGQKVAQYSLLCPPRLFMTVFDWEDINGSYNNMHEVLISLATELDISHIYRGLHSGCMYTLVSAPAGSWQESIERYRQSKLRPEILFFERVE
ncbi:Os11g0549610 [Oryza sativa Japonica Group]|uniref:Os11g0549610 protein n=1 Tax=Oryza sativa subsp. japonica TaxID=39947 RepID=A0A0P0Y3C5_ORYSJ|nr:Os11g0549610 [Oryza sativa Japonica Group]